MKLTFTKTSFLHIIIKYGTGKYFILYIIALVTLGKAIFQTLLFLPPQFHPLSNEEKIQTSRDTRGKATAS